MGPKKNQTVTKFRLVHRSQQDPLYYDDSVPNTVLVPIEKAADKAKFRKARSAQVDQLASEKLNDGEGQAALYGISYDDSEYNYLQHLKPIGQSKGAVFLAKDSEDQRSKHKNSKLAELLASENMLQTEEQIKYDYQRQQDIPDEIKGFKPNLNEDLREALTALEDENYLDEEQDVDEIDVFAQLLSEGKKQKELTLDEYDELNGNDDYYGEYDDDDDWDLDNFDEDGAVDEGDWQKDFSKFKKKQGKVANDWDSDDDFSDDYDDEQDGASEDEDDFVGDLPDVSKMKSSKSAKKKSKRSKGSKTDTSSYSMSSSAMARTEQMTIIDDKHDVLKEKYMAPEEEEDYQPFDLESERDDLMDLVDDFLDNYQLENRNRRIVKKNQEAEKYRQAALEVTKTKVKLQKPKPAIRGIVQQLDELSLDK